MAHSLSVSRLKSQLFEEEVLFQDEVMEMMMWWGCMNVGDRSRQITVGVILAYIQLHGILITKFEFKIIFTW